MNDVCGPESGSPSCDALELQQDRLTRLANDHVQPPKKLPHKPRLGFLGLGWIGRHRLQRIVRSGLAEIAAIADPQKDLAHKAAEAAPAAAVCRHLEDLLELELDGVVVATPSALHAEHTAAALRRGLPVFCQKPLGRTAEETSGLIRIARNANLLLGVDLSYRFLAGTQKIHALCCSGELGEIYAVDLVFHNAYGPNTAWSYDPQLSGGGCVIDLGIHLIDLAFWNLGFPQVTQVTGRLFSRGRPLMSRGAAVEDYAEAQLLLESGAVVRISCSWNLPAGCDAVIAGSFYGTKGGARFHNVNGSFYDFESERLNGRNREPLASDSEEWGGHAAVHWLQQLARDPSFDPGVETLSQVAAVLDAIYEGSPSERAGVVDPRTRDLDPLQPVARFV